MSLIVSLAFFFTYLPHLYYPFPIHVDEWNAILDANQIDEGIFDGGATDLRFGFHFFLAGLPINLLENYHLLPALFCIFSALLIFFTFREKLGEDQSFVTAIFFIIIKSSLLTLGHWFFTPLTFSIPFLLILHYAYNKYIDNSSLSSLGLLILTSSVLLVAYPVALLFYVMSQVFTCKWISIIRGNHRYVFLTGVLAILPLYLIILASVSRENPFLLILDNIVIPINWFTVATIRSPLEIFTWVGLISSIVGLIYVVRNKLWRLYLSELSWLITGSLWIALAYVSSYSLFIPTERIIFFTVLITPFFASFCFKSIFNGFRKAQKPILLLVVIIVAILSFPWFLDDFELTQPGHELYYAIEQHEYDFIKEQNLDNTHRVLAPVLTSLAIKVIMDTKVVVHPPFTPNMSSLDLVSSFYFSLPCNHIQNIFDDLHRRYYFSHVYSPHKIDCLDQDLTLLNSSNDLHLYQVNQHVIQKSNKWHRAQISNE